MINSFIYTKIFGESTLMIPIGIKMDPDGKTRIDIESKFKDFCTPVANYLLSNEVLARIKKLQAKIWLALDYPFIPLHNDTSERDIREYVRNQR